MHEYSPNAADNSGRWSLGGQAICIADQPISVPFQRDRCFCICHDAKVFIGHDNQRIQSNQNPQMNGLQHSVRENGVTHTIPFSLDITTWANLFGGMYYGLSNICKWPWSTNTIVYYCVTLQHEPIVLAECIMASQIYANSLEVQIQLCMSAWHYNMACHICIVSMASPLIFVRWSAIADLGSRPAILKWW